MSQFGCEEKIRYTYFRYADTSDKGVYALETASLERGENTGKTTALKRHLKERKNTVFGVNAKWRSEPQPISI